MAMSLVQVMYQLQRGPMLGEVAGHADERALLHARFLAASTPAALLMMAPALYLFSPATAAFQQVPALDLALGPGQSAFKTAQADLLQPLSSHSCGGHWRTVPSIVFATRTISNAAQLSLLCTSPVFLLHFSCVANCVN